MPSFSSKSKVIFDGSTEPKLGEEAPKTKPKPKVKKEEEAPAGFSMPMFKSSNKNQFDAL